MHTPMTTSLIVLAAGAAALALAASGCGGSSSSSGVARLGATSADTTTGAGGSGGSQGADGNAGLVRYAHCMRAHGLTEFPDPRGGNIDLSHVDVHSPQFMSADRACQHRAR